MESFEKKEESEKKFREEIFSKAVRAGKRTYFFDVKATRKNEYYLTITESKRQFEDDGRARYEKHKIFLYKEDFEKFMDSMNEIVGYIRENQPAMEEEEKVDEAKTEEYVNVDFDDLSAN